jgi:hypothetical protein
MDEIDRQQEIDERINAAMQKKRIDRMCIRCGGKIPAEILEEDPDAMACGGIGGCTGAA